MITKVAWGLIAAAGLGGRALGADRAGAFPASSPGILYEGRCVAGADGSVRMGFPGVTAHVRFAGASLCVAVRAGAELYLDAVVDGGAPERVRVLPGEGTYPIASALAPGEHSADIVRCNESWQGAVAILAFDAGPGGALLQAKALPPRRLMLIGDSVTCGEMTAWVPGMDLKDRAAPDARLSYGMVLARRLGAQVSLVGYGGRGVIRDWQGIRDTRNAPQFYELALPDEPGAWDHSSWVPDAVGIQLGTNDFNQGIPDENEFVNAFVELVRKVRRDAPRAFIFLMDSPILTDEPGRGPRRAAHHAYLEEVVARVGDARVVLAPLGHCPGVPGNGHPTGADHEAMARELEPVLRRGLGWQVPP